MEKNQRKFENGDVYRSVKLSRLLCEYAENPLGIDNERPRFCWEVENDGRGFFQTAYRVMVASSKEKLADDIADLWDSGKVMSDGSVGIEYNGTALQSRGIYYWKVCIWDQRMNPSGFSNIAWFEMGLLHKKDWQATWLGFHGSKCGQSLLFRNEFSLAGKPLKARAYLCGLGYNEFRINGRKVGNNVLDPAYTEYDKRILYVTYDITDYLKENQNVIGIMLGNGWYAGTALLFQMEIELGGGREILICSNPSFNNWQIAAGPIQANSIYDGEIYDAREEKSGWDMEGYFSKIDPKDYSKYWATPCAIHGPSGKLVSQMIEPIQVMGDMKPVNITKIKEKVFVYDMGQNFAGWARLKVSGPAGTTVTLKYAETLYDDGTANQENLRTALARDVYILKGENVEIYEPRFTYHGFRYVQVEGSPGEMALENITGRIVRSSVQTNGSFICSNELINKIHSNVMWTEASNLHGIPTDCPQRDERQGWLNDATVRGEETIYNFNMARFFPKWMDDIADGQDKETGAIPDTAPFGWGMRPADPVCSSYLIIPWLLYLHYGDQRTLELHYEGFKQWTRCLGNLANQFIINDSAYGDWAPPATEGVKSSLGDGAVSAITPGSLMSTGFYYYNSTLIAKMARVLGRKDDAVIYGQLAGKIKEAFNNKFFNSETANYATGSQSSNVFPLYLGIVPEEFRKSVLENVVQDIKKRNYHLSTGNICTKYILEVLAEEGYIDLAYRIVTQTTYPSWGYMISMGATTIFERWEYETGGAMNSHNHPMYATVGSWFYKYLAGIRVAEDAPGFKTLVIKPVIPENLDFVKCSLKTVKGLVTVNWKKNEHGMEFAITVPFNCKAEICLPISQKNLGNLILREGGRVIWARGANVENVEGISGILEKEGYLNVEAGSGSYQLYLENGAS